MKIEAACTNFPADFTHMLWRTRMFSKECSFRRYDPLTVYIV